MSAPATDRTDSWAIVQRAQAGDTAAKAELYKRYGDTVLKFVSYRVRSRVIAEDLTSDTWVRALKKLDSFTDPRTDIAAWLVTIARNRVADFYKAGWYPREITVDEVGDGQAIDRNPEGRPDETATDYLQNRRLLAAVKELVPEQQECIVLRFLRGLSVLETASVMGKNEGAIKALQYRACNNLRVLLGKSFDERMPEPRRMR